jgi:NAD(P)-dependent dehydrogenase (short-subunit alcohol dehydrogenase family)
MGALRDKAVLLSGATSGLGRALARGLAAEGCRLAICGRSPAKLAALEAELALPSPRLLGRAFDLTDHAAAATFAGDALGHLGGIDILINNAGANLGKAPAGDIDLGGFAAMLDLNCTAQLALTQPAWRAMAAAGGGRVVNILSSATRFATAGMGGYTAAKAAFDGLTGVLRREGKPLGIHVTAVYPGGIDTPFRALPRPDYLRPETVAEAILGLLRLPGDAAVHELVLRPPVEDNLA